MEGNVKSRCVGTHESGKFLKRTGLEWRCPYMDLSMQCRSSWCIGSHRVYIYREEITMKTERAVPSNGEATTHTQGDPDRSHWWRAELHSPGPKTDRKHRRNRREREKCALSSYSPTKTRLGSWPRNWTENGPKETKGWVTYKTWHWAHRRLRRWRCHCQIQRLLTQKTSVRPHGRHPHP